MSLIIYFLKEIYFKLIYFFIIFTIISFFTIINLKYIISYLLQPIELVRIKTITSIINNNEFEYTHNLTLNNIEFLPIIEINLPFLTTSYAYVKYIFYIILYISIPIYIYFYKLNIKRILTKYEYFFINVKINILLCLCILNFLITHYLIIPFFINITYNNYNEYSLYEFDVEFQIFNYLNFYFKLLYINSILLIILMLKQDLILLKEININVIIIIFLLVLPLDFIIQILYICLLLLYNIIIKIIINYTNRIKKHK